MNEMEMARSLDLQDRFINTKCTKYMLLNKQIARAESTIALFARVNTDNGHFWKLIVLLLVGKQYC
jgi:hypothetical protein